MRHKSGLARFSACLWAAIVMSVPACASVSPATEAPATSSPSTSTAIATVTATVGVATVAPTEAPMATATTADTAVPTLTEAPPTTTTEVPEPTEAATATTTPPTPAPTPPPTPPPPPEPTRPTPTIRLKLPPDGTLDDNGAPQLDASVVDPNYSPDGMRAMAFEVLVRVADASKQEAKINSVEFIIYASEEDFQNNSNPVFRHTEQNAPYCIFRESDNRCNEVTVEPEGTWPQSDDEDVEQVPFRDGAYILAIRIQAGDDNEMFWQSAVDFTLKTGD